ncbi:MAG: hypothetical protein I3273_01695 [Candidatus Moeniiplasma glomeromycotorum]|nr:hypothetical protein [Candidatus Moeniiplasma glomeromycotorum]MCE8167166.1 hypothetical protein [Candidatus Moeniiplasma glomeromycotorum]MCE8168822.1 hypothetical protein [Candidatus Moeniiplasma glomeromycotorum]
MARDLKNAKWFYKSDKWYLELNNRTYRETERFYKEGNEFMAITFNIRKRLRMGLLANKHTNVAGERLFIVNRVASAQIVSSILPLNKLTRDYNGLGLGIKSPPQRQFITY